MNTQGDPENQVAIGLSKIAMALRRSAWDRAGELGTNPAQAQVLSVLRAGGLGWMTQRDLVERLAVTQPTVSDSVQALVKKGLVETRRAEHDRRSLLVRLTEAGRQEADRLAQWPDYLLEAIGSLSPEEGRVFLSALVKMIRSLQEQGRIPVARMCVSCRYFRPFVYPGSDKPHHCMFVDAAFGDSELRTDCADHETADHATQALLWEAFEKRVPILPVGGDDPSGSEEWQK